MVQSIHPADLPVQRPLVLLHPWLNGQFERLAASDTPAEAQHRPVSHIQVLQSRTIFELPPTEAQALHLDR